MQETRETSDKTRSDSIMHMLQQERINKKPQLLHSVKNIQRMGNKILLDYIKQTYIVHMYFSSAVYTFFLFTFFLRTPFVPL